jgi:signal transduction histidine kinase
VFLVVLNIVGTLFSCSVVAFAFARLQWPGRSLSFGVMMATMMKNNNQRQNRTEEENDESLMMSPQNFCNNNNNTHDLLNCSQSSSMLSSSLHVVSHFAFASPSTRRKRTTLQQQFVSDVSHELRTPLTTVRMASEMIFDARKSLDPEIARSAELLRNQVDRFDLLLSDLLEMSKIDAGATVLNVTNFDLAELLSTEIEAASEIAKKHQTNIILYQSEVKTFVEADTRRICRIIRNLITNAVEHSESKSIEVTIKSNDSAISIGVRDYGQGMNTEDIGRVFDRFWRADPARKRTLGGTGLGLSISIEDAKLHSGDLAAWAAPGKGAHFVLTLPIRPNLEIVDPPIKAGPK